MTAPISRKRSLLKVSTALTTGFVTLISAPTLQAQSLPQIAAGNTIVPGGTATDMTIDIGTAVPKQVITWTSFSIGSGNSVSFSATNAGVPDLATAYAVLNRVVGTTAAGTTTIDPSIIAGSLTAQNNIAIWLVNPAGITFSSSGAYSGGSLVLSTLNITDGQFNGAGSQQFTPFAFGGSTVAGAGATQMITLTGGDLAKIIQSAGSVLMVGEQVDVGKRVTATGDIGLVAAQDVTFTAGAQSPLSYTIAQGTSMSGVRLIGNAQVSGANVTLAAVSRSTALDTLLDVSSAATLEATAVNGVITLTTTDNGPNTVPQNGDGIRSAGTFLKTNGNGGQVRLLSDGKIDVTGGSIGADGAVTLTARTSAAVRGAVDAGATYTVTGSSVTLGGAVTQQAAGNITAMANVAGPTNGDVTTETGLTVRSTGGSVEFGADGNAVLRGAIDAATTYTVNAVDVTLGGSSQKSVGLMDVNATGALVTEAGLTLQTTGTTADVDLSAGTTATLSSAVDAGRDYLVGAGTGITLGAAAVTQKAGRNVVLSTAAGDIAGASTMTLNGVAGAYLFAPTGAVKLAIDSVLTGVVLGLDYAAGADITLGDVSGVTFGRTASVAAPNDVQTLGSFTARDITLSSPTGTLSLTATGDIKGRSFTVDGTGGIKLIADGNITGLTGTAPINLDAKTNALEVRADRLVQGGVFKGAAVIVAGGNLLGSGNDGSVELTQVDATGNLTVNAFSISTANAQRDGEIRLGRATVGGTTILDNTAGAVGDIIIANQIDSIGSVTIKGAADLRLATFNSTTNVGRVRSSTGNVTATLGGSIFGIAGSAAASGTGGILAYEATGDLTVTSGVGADAIVNSLKAGGNLSLSISGALVGSTASAVPLTSGAIVADGAGGTVTVTAGVTGGAVQSIVLDTVQASAITLRAEKVAVGTVIGAGAATLAVEDQSGSALGTSDFQIALRRITGNGTVNFTGTGVGTNVVAADTALRTNSPEFLNASFGKTDLDAGGTITGTVANAAQLGKLTAGGLVNITAGGLVADLVQSSASVTLAANTGTLSLRQISGAVGLSLSKTGGSAATDGDELRVLSGSSISGGATLASSTNLRVGSLAVSTGNVGITVANDLSGVRLSGAATALTDVATGNSLNANYDLAGITATTGNVTFNNAGSHAQFGAVTAGGDIVGLARSVSASSFNAGGQIDVSANPGTLVIGSAQAGTLLKLTKVGGSLDTEGDELRVLTTGVGGAGVTVDSATHVRVGTGLTATTGDLSVRVDGDVSGLLTGTFERLPAVSLGRPLSGQYGVANLTSTLGSTSVTASTGGVQIGTLNAGLNGSVVALGLTVNSAGIGVDLGLTATSGTLDLGTGTVGRTSLLTKQGGTAASALLGNELRVGSLTGGTTTNAGGVTLLSNTSVRAGAVTAERGDLVVVATLGDVSGLLTGTPEALPTMALGRPLSGQYGVANLTSTLANATVAAAAGGVQIGTLVAGGSGSVTALALTVNSAGIGVDLGLTATSGTLDLGTGTVGRTSLLTKQGGSLGTLLSGDELRVGTLTGGTTISPGGITLTSNTSVRAGTVTAQRGNLAVTATLGDVSGLRTGTPEALATITLDDVLSTNYGRANLAASLGSVSVDALGGGVQLGTVRAGTSLTVNAKAITLDDDNDTNDQNAATTDARIGTSLALTANDGTLHLRSATVGADTTLTKNINSPVSSPATTPGNELRVGSLFAGQTAGATQTLLDSDTHIRAGMITASNTPLTLLAAGDISGLLVGTPQPLDLVTTLWQLASQYGATDLTTPAGDITVNAGGGAQLGQVLASGAVSVMANALSIDSAGGGTVGLTARVGSLIAGSISATGAITATKQGGSAGTDGDDLRVRTTTLGGSVAFSSQTSVRTGGLVRAATGNVTVNAITGDVSGLLIGTFERLPLVTTGEALSSRYGGGQYQSVPGDVVIDAVVGGVQLSTVTAGQDVRIGTIDGVRAISVSDLDPGTLFDATAGRDLTLAASTGTLVVSDATVGRTALLTKQAGNLATDGDDLRITRLVAGTSGLGGLSLTSNTSVRADRLTAQAGDASVIAVTGDVSGLKRGLAFGPLALTTDTIALSSAYKTLDTIAQLGSVTIRAVAGGAQLGVTQAATNVDVRAMAITADDNNGGTTDVDAGLNADLTATAGTLYVNVATVGGTATLAKTGGSIGTLGDDLRVETLTAGTAGTVGGATLTSSTSVRADTITAQRGNLAVTATAGDISGLQSGALAPLATVSTTPSLRGAFGRANLVSTLGSVTATAAAGGIQLDRLTAAINAEGSARSLTVTGADAATGALVLTATAGTLVLGTGTAGTTASLIKQGGSAATDGDDLRVTTLTGGTGVTLTSSTSLRVGTATATTGDLAATATTGDISGALSGAFARLPAVSTNVQLSGDYGLATLRALSGNASATASAGGIQLATLAASRNAMASAGSVSIGTATATTGLLGVTATAGTLVLGTGTAGTTASLTKQGGSAATDGDDLRVTTLTGGTGVTLTSSTSLRVGTATATTGDLAATATTGDISGLLTGTFERLPTTWTTGRPSANYGLANLVATLGAANVGATAGGVQLARLVAGTDAIVLARAVSIDDGNAGSAVDASAGRDLTLTAETGTLQLSGGTAGRTAALTKKLGSAATAGDELRVDTLTAGTAAAPGGVTLASATSIRAGKVTAQRGAITLTATSGDATGLAGTSIGTSAIDFGRSMLTAATDVTVTAGGLVQGGAVTATGGAITVTGGSATSNGAIDVTSLVAAGASTLTATAKAPVTSTVRDGDILVGGATTTGGALLARNTAGNAGSISFGGSVDAASVTVNAVDTAALLDRVTTPGAYTVTAGGDVTLGGAIPVIQRANGAVTISTTGAMARIVQGSAALTVTANADGVGTEALTLSAPGGIALGNTALAGGTAGRQSGVTLTSTGGAISVNTVTGASLGSTSATGFTANGAITVGNASIGADATAGPSTLDIKAGTGGITAQAITVTDAGHDLRLGANGAISIGALTAARSIIVGGSSTAAATSFNAASLTATSGSITGKAGTIAVPGSVVAGGALDLDASSATAALATQAGATITVGGDVTLATVGAITLGDLAAGTRNVTITASDAVINGTVTAARITVINRAATANVLRLGSAAGTGFVLDAAELNRFNAAAVIIDAGTGTGLTRQDVEIGDLPLTLATIRTLDILGLQRIDVTGAISKGTSGLTALRIGGTATATDMASVLRVAANANGTGGRIDVDTATLDLRAAKIGVGQDDGFLKTLGVTAGSAATQTALDMSKNPFSGLYSAGGAGGLFYTTLGQVLVKAASMRVSYTDFALFQNTQLPGFNGGVSLGSISVAATPGLDLSGPATGQAGPFGMFGSINGVTDTATALLGPTTIVVTAVDRTSARINGCLIGSGSGCINNVLVNPVVEVSGRVRGNLLLPNGNFELPFDPLVGTNNDSLFGDVGSFGLSDIPLGEIDCDKPGTAGCATRKEAN